MKKFFKKKYSLFIALLLLGLGILAGVYVTGQQQDIRNRADENTCLSLRTQSACQTQSNTSLRCRWRSCEHEDGRCLPFDIAESHEPQGGWCSIPLHSSSPSPTPTPVATIPNCNITSSQSTLTVGQTGTFTGEFTSPQGNLSGQIFRSNSFTPLDCSGCRPSAPGVKDFGAAVNNGTFTWTWTPGSGDIGSHSIYCRAWNDAIAECRPQNLVDGPPRFACSGPNVSKTVTVSAASVANTPTNTPANTPTNTPINSPTPTSGIGGFRPTVTPTRRPTVTPTRRLTVTPTRRPTGSASPSATIGLFPSITPTPFTTPPAPQLLVNPFADANKVAPQSFTLTGTSSPNAQITIEISPDGIFGTATADENGAWRYILIQKLTPGTKELRVTATDINGVSSTYTETFTVKGGGIGAWIWTILGLFAAIVVFIIIRRRMNQPPPYMPPPTSGQENGEGSFIPQQPGAEQSSVPSSYVEEPPQELTNPPSSDGHSNS